ncbi:hypothetical protein [Micromonospora sp. NPDC002717]|uniref:hypothetical protein n=1 Tax=Micromonospora sp. NPDC002717 TaxID=3154424 RepID=UPI003321F5D5
MSYATLLCLGLLGELASTALAGARRACRWLPRAAPGVIFLPPVFTALDTALALQVWRPVVWQCVEGLSQRLWR